MIDVSTITIPTPEPYDENAENRQRENFYYVLNQILVQIQDGGVEQPAPSDLLTAIDALQFNHAVLRFGDLEIVLSAQSAGVGSS